MYDAALLFAKALNELDRSQVKISKKNKRVLNSILFLELRLYRIGFKTLNSYEKHDVLLFNVNKNWITR